MAAYMMPGGAGFGWILGTGATGSAPVIPETKGQWRNLSAGQPVS
jgi:hypothetical protein